MQVFNEFLRDNFERTRNHALQLSGMGPFKDGEAIEYISFLKESLKHRLHSMLWTHQEKMAAYAASTRTSVSARQPFHQLNTLLAQLGAPNYRRKRTSYTMNRRYSTVLPNFREFVNVQKCDISWVTQKLCTEPFLHTNFPAKGCGRWQHSQTSEGFHPRSIHLYGAS